MPELRVPYAVDAKGRLHSPETAQKGMDYVCPACREPVIFRQGEIRAAHFAHKASNTCNQETIAHKTAKLLIQNTVHEWKTGGRKPPVLQRACRICGASVNQPLPDKVDRAVLEHRLEDGSVADVALLVGETPQAVVEIKVTHAVDEVKANRLPVPFIELDGYEVIGNPAVWKPIADNFRPLTCEKCKSHYARFQAKARQVARANNIELPAAYYRYGLHKCWKCSREILVFAWPKEYLHDDAAPKARPRPRTVRYRFSRTVGHKYWVNTCPYCRSIQGDFFLYHEFNGPFFAVYVEEDSPAAFERDMLKIAMHAAQNGLL